MKLRDNDIGMLWDRSTQQSQTRAPRQPISHNVILPPCTWTAPTELPSLDDVKRIAIDVETRDEQLTALGPGVRRPNCYVIGIALGTDDGRRWYFPVRHEGGGNLDEGLVWAWAREEMNAFTGRVTGAKLDYDLDWLAENGVTFAKCAGFDDVQIAEPLIDEWRYEFNLDALASDYLGEHKVDGLLREVAERYGWTTDKELKSNLWRLPAAYAGAYAEGDVDLPLRILPLQMAKIESEGLSTIYSIESRLIPILVAMRRRGVRVDIERTDQIREQLVERRDEALARFRHIAGPKAELMAPGSFAKAFIDRGIQVPLTEKTKKPSITKGWLEKNKNDELAAAIIAGRKVNSIITTFIDGHIKTHAIKGRIHCQFHQLKGEGGGTIARLSSSLPNLQNIPSRDEELGPMIRGLFLPDEGEQWGRWDYSQIEYRLLTHFAVGPGAEEARQKYRDDPKTNFHKFCAKMLSLDPEDATGMGRVKSTNFCKVYGGGVAKVAATVGCTYEEALAFSELYDKELPFVKATLDAAMRWAKKNGYVTSILGRKQRFSLWEPINNRNDKRPPLPYDKALAAYGSGIQRYMMYVALNRKNQSSSADITKKAMVDSWEAGIQAVLGPQLITVHDENDSSIPLTKAGKEAARETTRIMEQAVKLKVPVLVKSELGSNWGNCK